jgi:hypothetical protein
MRCLGLAQFLVACVTAGCAHGSSDRDGAAPGNDGGQPGSDAGPGAVDAGPPGVEICDGLDNDADFFIDEGSLLALCGEPAHGTARCNGMLGCVVESCEDRYYDIDGAFANGCECELEASEQGADACASAVDLGDFADTNAAMDRLGNLIPAGDVDFYRLRAVDTPDTSCDTFHVRALLLDNPGDEYLLDVWRGGCGATPLCEGVTDMQWYTNFSAGGVGECPCGPTEVNHCNDDTAEYIVGVRRADGKPVSCAGYRLELSNGKYAAP